MTRPLDAALRWAAACVLVAAATARADVLTDYAQVQVQAFGRSGLTPLVQLNQSGTGDLDTGERSGSDAFGFAGAGRASVTLRSDGLLRAQAWSAGPAPIGTSDFFATAWSRALFQDAIAYADPAVDTLRFRFALDGTFAVSDVSGGAFTAFVSRAYLVAFGNGTSFSAPVGPPTTPAAGAGLSVLVEDLASLFPGSNGHRTVVTTDWIAPQLSALSGDGFGYGFDGSFEVVSRRLSGPGLPAGGIFPLVVGIDAVASNRGGASAADFFGTLRLTGVTDGTGAPLALASLQFESGLQPIPEPSSTALLLAGLVPLGAIALRRRRG